MPDPIFTKVVEVLGVSRAVESATGKAIFQVTFGEMVALSNPMRGFFPQPQGTMPPEKLGVNVLVLFFDASGSAPFRVGSRWTVNVTSSGEITVKPVSA